MAPIACSATHMTKFTPLRLTNPKVSHFAFITTAPQFYVRCGDENKEEKKRLSEQSSWEAKDAEGRDYLYRLGKEADNMNIAVGQRDGIIDHLFAGNFLGKDSDIVFDYRQKVTRSFEYLQGDYYIAPLFLSDIAKRQFGWTIDVTPGFNMAALRESAEQILHSFQKAESCAGL